MRFILCAKRRSGQSGLDFLNGDAREARHVIVCFGQGLTAAEAGGLHAACVGSMDSGHGVFKDDTGPRAAPSIKAPWRNTSGSG